MGNLNLALVGWGIQTSRKHVSILNIEEFKDKESAFVRKWLRSKIFKSQNDAYEQKKPNNNTKNQYVTLQLSTTFVDHLKIVGNSTLSGVQNVHKESPKRTSWGFQDVFSHQNYF